MFVECLFHCFTIVGVPFAIIAGCIKGFKEPINS